VVRTGPTTLPAKKLSVIQMKGKKKRMCSGSKRAY
jgi:hypothetical protein